MIRETSFPLNLSGLDWPARIELVRVLKRCRGNLSRAATALDVDRRTLVRKLKDWKVREDEY